MTSHLLICHIFLLFCGEVVALHCLTCKDVDRHLGQSTLMCEDSYAKNHTTELLQGCSSPESGYTSLCTKFGGRAEYNDQTGSSSVIMEGISRGCVTFKDNSLPKSKCYYGEEANLWLTSLVPDTEGATVNGLICFCEGTGCNSVGSAQPFFWLLLVSLLTFIGLVVV